jgi:hypothetical protein
MARAGVKDFRQPGLQRHQAMNRPATVLRRGVAVACAAIGLASTASGLRAQCGVAVSPGQLAAMVEKFQ